MSKTKITYYMDIDESGAVRGAGRVDKELKDVDRQAKRTQSRFSKLSSVMGTAFVGALGLAFQQGVSKAIDKGSEFESKLAELSAITGISGQRLQRLGDQSLDLSTKYGTAASDIVEANKLVASQLAQKIDFNTEAGFRQLQQISEQAVVLQKAAGIPLANAVDATARSINQFDLSASQGAEVINTLAAGSKYGAAEIPYITEAMVNAGTAAHSAGQGIGITTAAIEELAAKGQKAETTGRSLRAIFTRLQTKGKELAEAGIENVDIKSDGLIKTLRKLQPIMGDATALTKIFGQENINQIQILGNNVDAIEELNGKMQGTQTAYKQADKNLNTFDGASNRLWETINKHLIKAFQQNNGLLVEMANGGRHVVDVFAEIISLINRLTPLLLGAAGGWAAYQLAVNGAAIATKVAEVAQKAWNVAMEANPIGLVVAALAGLVAVLYSNEKAWSGFKTLISGVWDFLKQVFFNLPEIAKNDFMLLGEILRTPFVILEKFARKVFKDITGDFKLFIYGMQQALAGNVDVAGAIFSTLGDKISGEFVKAAGDQWQVINDRLNAAMTTVDFSAATAKMAAGGAQMGHALADMFTGTAKQGLENGSAEAAGKAGQQLSNTSVDATGNLVTGGPGGAQAGPGKIGFARQQTVTGTQGQTFNTQAIAARVAARKKEAAQVAKLNKLKADSADKEKTLAELAGATGQATHQAGQVGARAMHVLQGVTEQFGQALVNAVVQGNDLGNVLASIARQLASKALITGLKILLTGGGSFFGSFLSSFAQGGVLDTYPTGGLLNGPGHDRGGVKLFRQGLPIAEAEGGEYIINKRSTRGAMPVLDAINNDPGLARQISDSYVGGGGALTINAMPASSDIARSRPRDIASEVSRGIKQGLQQATIVAPVQLRHLDEEQKDERDVQRYMGNNV